MLSEPEEIQVDEIFVIVYTVLNQFANICEVTKMLVIAESFSFQINRIENKYATVFES